MLYHDQMDEKRAINVDLISASGLLICRIGKFALFLVSTGNFKLIDEDNGAIICGMSTQDAIDLNNVMQTISEWTDYHYMVHNGDKK